MSAPSRLARLDDDAPHRIVAARVRSVKPNLDPIRPLYRLELDLGPPLGRRHFEAALTARYAPEDLLGRTLLVALSPPEAKRPKLRLLQLLEDDGGVALVGPAS